MAVFPINHLGSPATLFSAPLAAYNWKSLSNTSRIRICMKISCTVNGVSNSGKPSFRVGCEHCKTWLADLSSWVYQICRERGVEPSVQPKQASQTFEWVVNSDACPKKLKRQLCLCDENPTGLIGSWFKTNTRQIESYELESACAQIQLYAIKDGLDPDSSECLTAIRELRRAVKVHNKAIAESVGG